MEPPPEMMNPDVKISAQQYLSRLTATITPLVYDLVNDIRKVNESTSAEDIVTLNGKIVDLQIAIDMKGMELWNIVTPVPVPAAAPILNYLKELKAPVSVLADEALKKKPVVDALPVKNMSQLFGMSIGNIQTSVANFANHLIDKLPDELKPQLETVKKEYDGIFKKVLDVYK